MSAINAFSIGGIRVRIDQSWFIAFLLFAYTLSVGYFPMQAPDYSAFTYWLLGTLSSLALFASVLAHELSHCIVARQLGIGVRQITLFIFGGVSEMEQTHSSTPKAEFKISIAGPLASIGMGAFFLATSVLLGSVVDRIVVAMFHYLYYVNFLLAIFNLMPGFPLDGGRVLRSYLWHRSGSLRQATRSASRIGILLAMGFVFLGLMGLLTMRIIPGIWLILIGMFLKKSAETEYQSFEMRVGLKDVTLRQIMAPAVAVNTRMSVQQLVNDFVFHYHYRTFPVLENGRFVGMVDILAIKKLPPDDWGTTNIGSILADPSNYREFEPDMQAADALREMFTSNISKAAVVHHGELLGFITRNDLFKVITLKNDLAA